MEPINRNGNHRGIMLTYTFSNREEREYFD